MNTKELSALYGDAQRCAQTIGLCYSSDAQMQGLTRHRHGKEWSFKDVGGRTITDQQIKEQILKLAIPPAWQNVWICPGLDGHILATGTDEKGRKQYIYHPQWRTMRDLIKFYRMMLFGTSLPRIRKSINTHLQRDGHDFYRVIAAMLWIMDSTYIRVGNETYFQQNDSVGLTTLTDYNIITDGSMVAIGFNGKSGVEQHITFENPTVAKIVAESKDITGDRLFQYLDANGQRHAVTSTDINKYLHEITGVAVSAKDFRTWGGTLAAFTHLIANQYTDKKTNKVMIEAVDAAAGVLGNTRSVAKSSYVHPHILEAYAAENFSSLYDQVKTVRKKQGLDKRETELLHFLELLFTSEFDLLKKGS
ncbi:DNA topoisomerase I [Candidatus Saccharibacteria bacterium]|nr:MAG: DNA topoisomerase I [Candidatus Saccharibacteria bacterium]